jgi:molybdate transport system ATP-binding protein
VVAGRVSLEAALRADLGSLQLEVDVSVGTGELVAVLGPNGAGKTTFLRAVAGLVPLTEGRVVLDGEILEDARAGVRVPVEKRSIGFVFQDYLLFPHLSALENIAFGLRARGSARAEARAAALNWLEQMGLGWHSDSRPGALSGGQAQRVALARALAIRPRLLLLDEPLAALDAGARVEMRRNLLAQLRAFEGTRILVTHDPIEALSLADRVVVIEDGGVAQCGSPDELRERPRTNYVANLVGANLFRGNARGHRVTLSTGGELTIAQSHTGAVFAVVHPRAVALYKQRPEGTPRNIWSGVIDGLEQFDDRVRVRVSGDVPVVAEITPSAVSALELAEGTNVWVSIKASELTVYRV